MSPKKNRPTPTRKPPASRREKNIELTRERLEMEFDLAMKFIDRQVSHLFPGLLGALLNPIVEFLYRFMQREASVKRYRRQLELLIECAGHYNGKNLDKLVEENLERYLQTEELYVRGNKRHPKFPEAVALLREAFRGRLEPVARLLDGEGETYEDLTRSVFPDRREAEEILRTQAHMMQKLLDMVRREPGLVSIPGPLQAPLWKLAEAGLDYAREELRRQLDETYGTPKGTAKTGKE